MGRRYPHQQRRRATRASLRRQASNRCTQCDKHRYSDEIAATINGAYWNQRAYPCPAGQGWHLSSKRVRQAA